MRLIDADELKSRMINYYSNSWKSCEEILDFFANSPTIEPEQHWIPCSERLPEDDGYCLGTCGDDNRTMEVAWFDKKDGRFAIYNIIAWMQLPEPYNGE